MFQSGSRKSFRFCRKESTEQIGGEMTTDIKIKRIEGYRTKIRSVPIAVTPEGFWCCPSPAALQKSLKNPSPNPNPNPSPNHAFPSPTSATEKKPSQLRSRMAAEDLRSPQRKISVGFGNQETSDLKVILSGKDGVAVRMNVHREVLADHSIFFADRLSPQSPPPVLDLPDCEDVEIYVETIGLMYAKDVKQRLMKQSVSRVLRIMKVAEGLGFQACVRSCLEHLEAVPWVEDEEENVLSSVRHLHLPDLGASSRILRRVSSTAAGNPNSVIEQVINLVLRSRDARARREMKSLVLRLLREITSADLCKKTLREASELSIESLLKEFRQAEGGSEVESILKEITIAADNLLWLVEIMADQRSAEEFAGAWAAQEELAALHGKIPAMARHLVSRVTARLFVAIGRGEVLPEKEIRRKLLRIWLPPLMGDYNWLQQRRRSFDGKMVEEGIGRTILTLPLEEQESALLTWLGAFLKAGDGCPNLQRAFEVWWRRSFIRPYSIPNSRGLIRESNV